MSTYTLLAQEPSFENLKPTKPKRFIDKIEVFAGPSLYFPNDHGWSDFIYNGSDFRSTYEINSERGYFMGICLIQSVGKRFELQGKILLEKRRYSESRAAFDWNGYLTSTSETLQKNDYTGFSLVPAYFVADSKQLHFFSGISYYRIKESIAIATDYSPSGQPTGGAIVDTKDGFKQSLIDALVGVGYAFPITRKFEFCIRVQGNHWLSYTVHQQNFKISVNSVSISCAIRYIR